MPLGPVEEPLWSGVVEADNPVAQGLAIHGAGFGGFGSGCTLQGERNRHHAQGLGSVLCPACQLPQFGWITNPAIAVSPTLPRCAEKHDRTRSETDPSHLKPGLVLHG